MDSTLGKRRAVPSNLGLLRLVRAKREQSWKPSAEESAMGFRGWHQRGYLPHFDVPGVTQFVTFQLSDSFPPRRTPEWETLMRDPDCSTRRRQLEAWLDRGRGDCWLRRKDVANAVENVLLEGNARIYQLRAWVIMPNHAHVVLDIWRIPMSDIVQRWKGKSSRLANAILARGGRFWQADYFDTVIRDEQHLRRAIRYTEQNPVKAHLVKSPREWLWGSARQRDQFEQLPWERGR